MAKGSGGGRLRYWIVRAGAIWHGPGGRAGSDGEREFVWSWGRRGVRFRRWYINTQEMKMRLEFNLCTSWREHFMRPGEYS